MRETADTQVNGAPDYYNTGLAAGECKDQCSSDNQCVIAMHQSSTGCFIYYSKTLTEQAGAGSTLFMKMVTSTGVLKYIL